MIETQSTFYVTTAIDYPNSAPHMGHAYEKVVADFYARSARLRSLQTHFVIGLDEHGQKIQEAAKKAGKAPKEFVDEKAKIFRKLYDVLKISHDDFIRTSESRHHKFCQDLYVKVRDKGDIYKGHYEGDYCIGCERFYTPTELEDGKCPVHGEKTRKIQEESYFFRLSSYREALRKHIEENPEFIYPVEKRNEILARLSEEVRDLSISRSTFDWGVPVPDDPEHVMYVWFDALSNYLSAIQEPAALHDTFWPADCHVIGKDINWFHSVIWPSMLMSAGYPLPRQVYVHGFILDKDGRKMSKALGNVVDPLKVIDDYSAEVLRFYFLRCVASGQDGNFSLSELEDRYVSELGNELGNLVLRVAKLVNTRLGGSISTPGNSEALDGRSVIADYFRHADGRDHHRAVDVLWGYVKRTNAFMNDREPWKVKDEKQFVEILGACVDALRTIAYLLVPIMPHTAKQVAGSLGIELNDLSTQCSEPGNYRLTMGKPLFPRRESTGSDTASDEKKNAKKTTSKAQKDQPTAVDPFAKLELRVGRIVDVREHPDADALFAMRVDVGEEEPRSICAGLRGHVTEDDLKERKVLVVANLKPAKLRGIESRGMVLAADLPSGSIVPVNPGDAPIGDLVGVDSVESRPKKKLSKSEFEKAPLRVEASKVSYMGNPLRSSTGPVVCDADDGAVVR